MQQLVLPSWTFSNIIHNGITWDRVKAQVKSIHCHSEPGPGQSSNLATPFIMHHILTQPEYIATTPPWGWDPVAKEVSTCTHRTNNVCHLYISCSPLLDRPESVTFQHKAKLTMYLTIRFYHSITSIGNSYSCTTSVEPQTNSVCNYGTFLNCFLTNK